MRMGMRMRNHGEFVMTIKYWVDVEEVMRRVVASTDKVKPKQRDHCFRSHFIIMFMSWVLSGRYLMGISVISCDFSNLIDLFSPFRLKSKASYIIYNF